MSKITTNQHPTFSGVFNPDDDPKIEPKWLVLGVALLSLALVFNYDVYAGLIGSASLAFIVAVYLWASIRLASARGEPASGREAMFRRFSMLSSNRYSARVKEFVAKGKPKASRLTVRRPWRRRRRARFTS